MRVWLPLVPVLKRALPFSTNNSTDALLGQWPAQCFANVEKETWQVLTYRREPEGYVLDCQSSHLSVWRGATPHIGCSGRDALHLMYDGVGLSCGFGRLDDGEWVLRSIQGQDVFSMDPAK